MYSGEYLDIIEVGIQGPPGTGMPAGGLKDDILAKKSDANYDYIWRKYKTVLERHKSINEEELRDGLLWNNTSSDVIQYYDGSIIKTLLYSEGSETDQVLCGSSLPNGNLILKSTSAEEKGSIIIPEFNTPGIIVNDELGYISTISQLPIENLPPHSSSIAEFGVASKELYGHVKIGSSIAVDNGVIDVDINTGKGLEYIGETPNKILEIDDTVVTLNATQTLTNKTLTAPKFANNGYIADINDNELLTFNSHDSAVNNIVVVNAVKFDSPVIRADGDDINVDLILKAKGAGSVKVDSDIITTNNAVQTLTNKILTTPRIINNDYIADLNGNKLLMFGSVPAAKTYLKLINNTVENDVILEVLGSDNVGLNIIPNGSGNIQINNDVITTNTAKQLLNNKILYKPIISSLYQDPEKINEITFPAISDTVVTLKAEQTLKNKILTTPKIISDDYISDINGNELLMFGSTPSAETYLKLTNNTAGNNTILEALGSMNTGLDIVTSGTGTVRINNDVVTTNTASQTLTHKTLTEPTIGNFVNANHNHSNNVNGGQITDAALSSPVTPAKGGTGFNSYTLGDIIYASSPDTLVKLPGNTTTDTKLLTQTGTGTKSSSPEWKKYKHEQVIGDGISTEYTINHNLNTRAHTISIWRNIPPYDEIDYYVEKTTLNTITLYFDRVLQQDEFSVVIIG